MSYLYALKSIILAFLAFFLTAKSGKKEAIFECKTARVINSLVFTLGLICACGSFIYGDLANNVGQMWENESHFSLIYALNDSPYGKGVTLLSALGFWFFSFLITALSVYPYFSKNKIFSNVIKYFGPFAFVFSAAFYGFEFHLLVGDEKLVSGGARYACAIFFGIICYNLLLCFSHSLKVVEGFEDTAKTGLFFLGTLLACLPVFEIQVIFGSGDIFAPVGLSWYHRIIINFCILLPFIWMIIVRNYSMEDKKLFFTLYSVGATLLFLIRYDYRIIVGGQELPLHICNVSLIFILICLVWKRKNLFYFTYFYSVFAAFCACFIPDLARGIYNGFSSATLHFFLTHFAIISIPPAMVESGLMPRPKFKDYLMATGWFYVYLVAAIILNNLLGTNYFFLNDDTITSKFGQLGKVVFNIVYKFEFLGKNFTIRPVYYIIMAIAFPCVVLCMWFLYSFFYKIEDRHRKLHLIKLKKKLLKSYQENGENMDNVLEIKKTE